MAKVNLITTALDTCFTPATRGARTVLDLRMPQNVKLESVEYAKALLVCYRQLEVYVR